jgi:hypothetical protein
MARPVRITRVDGAVLADCLYLIGQALVKFADGDDGGNEDLAAAERLVPAGGINELLRMVADGELPAPGPGPEATDAWLEACRMAGAGELVLFRILFPSAAQLAQEDHDVSLRAWMRSALRPNGAQRLVSRGVRTCPSGRRRGRSTR